MSWPQHLIHGVVMVSLLGVTCDDGHIMRDIPGIEAGWASLSSADLARSRSPGAIKAQKATRCADDSNIAKRELRRGRQTAALLSASRFEYFWALSVRMGHGRYADRDPKHESCRPDLT